MSSFTFTRRFGTKHHLWSHMDRRDGDVVEEHSNLCLNFEEVHHDSKGGCEPGTVDGMAGEFPCSTLFDV